MKATHWQWDVFIGLPTGVGLVGFVNRDDTDCQPAMPLRHTGTL